jgi:amino acid transporter
VLYIGHKLITRSKLVIPAEADLQTGKLSEDEPADSWEESKRSGWKAMMGKIF